MPEEIIRPGAAASGRVTPASFPFYTTGEDNLRIISYNSAASVTLKINARTLDNRGIPTPSSWDHTPNTDRTSKTSDFALGGATLLNLTVFAGAGAPMAGQTFVIVQLVRGIGTAAIVLGTILQGYVTATQAIGWPGSPIQSFFESTGFVRSIIGTDPPAGTLVTETVPVGARWQLSSLVVNLVTDGTVTTRTPRIVLASPSATLVNVVHFTTIGAGTNGTFGWAVGLPFSTAPATSFPVTGLPTPFDLLAGWTVTVAAEGFQAGDNFAGPRYSIREWLEP